MAPLPVEHDLNAGRRATRASNVVPSVDHNNNINADGQASRASNVVPMVDGDINAGGRASRASNMLPLVDNDMNANGRPSRTSNMLPRVDNDINVGGRVSRASNMSAASRASRDPGAASDADYALAPGVARMLRNSTDTGNLDSLMAPDSFGVGPNMQRASRRGTASRMSTASSHSVHSNRERASMSMHRPRPSQASSAPRHSRENVPQYVPQYVPDTLSPTQMNIPGSSPYFPQATRPRNGVRSFSMTHDNVSEPALPLSGNRSYNSLRSSQQMQHPPDSYRYPSRTGRSGYRSPSPAWSEPYGGQSRRVYSQGGQHYAQPPMQDRLKARSDMSLRGDSDISFRGGPPLRSRSPVYFGDMQPGIPPVPPLDPHRYQGNRIQAADRSQRSQKSYRSLSHRSGPPSASSGSTNRRGDSDAPSSDNTSPPTPLFGVAMGGFRNLPATQAHTRAVSRVVREETTSYQEYSDYTEQFENEPVVEPEPVAVPTGYVHRMKGILEERGSPDPDAKKACASVVEEVLETIETVPRDDDIDVVELPASPVPRRLTKELVRSVVGFVSPTGAVESHDVSARASTSGDISANDEKPVMEGEQADRPTALQKPPNSTNRYSILSQAGSSVMNSSTLEFAVHSLIPMAANNSLANATGDAEEGSVDVAPTTEDGMSDLLDGYQHTDVKQETESGVDAELVEDGRTEKRSSHGAKSSDEESFKSCTDLPDLTEKSVAEVDAKEAKAGEKLPEPGIPSKESDAKSFKSCKDVVTPERAGSLPDSKLQLSRLTASEPKFKRPASEMPRSSPLSLENKQPPPSASDSSMIKASSKFRPGHKPGTLQGSAAASVSSSTHSGLRQPPPVPRRESSSSKEAQRSNAALSWLAKATSGFGRKPAKKEIKQQEEDNSQSIPTPPPMRKRTASSRWSALVDQSSEIDKASSVPVSQAAASMKHNNLNALSENRSEAQEPLEERPPASNNREVQTRVSLSSSPALAEGSSVYSPMGSPETGSFALKHVQKPSPALSQTPDGNRRDSQTTTHLSWPVINRRPVSNATNGSDDGVIHGIDHDETTTTDLRPAAYRKYTLNYLPDLKEESHEDSSLNTSASNLKHSNFRFPGAVAPDVRVSRISVEDAAMLTRSTSVKSYRKSVIAKDRCLPSMEFSEMNLLKKLGDFVEHRGSRSMELSPEMREEFEHLERSRPVSAGGLDMGNTTSSMLADASRNRWSFSPQALKEEVDNLNIPSVDGLTLRVSELMPSLKENCREDGSPEGADDFVEEEKIMEHALEEIKEVSKPAPKQSIARLRPVAGSSSVVVMYDDLYKEPKQTNQNDGGSTSAKELGEIGATKGRSWSVAHTAPRDKTKVTGLEAPSSAVLRARSLSLGHPELRVSSESRLSSPSTRTLDSTPTRTVTDTRPWNRDENYPWATTESVDIDISLPRSAATRSSPRPGPSNLRHRLSNTSSTSGTFSPDGTSGSPASPTGTAPASASLGPPTHARRESLKRWSLFAHKELLSSPTGFDASGFATGPVRVRDDDQSHGAGDRYPTSALPLPSHLHIADSTSRLSDYTTDEDAEPFPSRKGRSIRKVRRSKKAAASRPKSSRAQEVLQSVGTDDSEDASTGIQPRVNRRTFSGAEGMSRWTYLTRKVVYKVKILYVRVRRRLGRRTSETEGSRD